MLLRAIALAVLLTSLAGAQTTTPSGTGGAAVSGTVRDSLAHTSLAGATVQLVAADNPARFGSMAISDSLGRFSFAAVPAGRYNIGFFHPLLDSLGVDAPLREVIVDGTRPVRADVATPSAARFKAAICGARVATDSNGVIIGVVRDAKEGTVVPNASVTGDWLEYSFTATGIVRKLPRLIATTGENGWFALCNVPSDGMVALRANRGADSTDLIEVYVSKERFLRRELYIGASRTTIVGDTTRRDSLAPTPRRMKVGDGRLSGTVVRGTDGRPLEGASVAIVGGPQTRTNARGEWTIADAPAGTRMLEVRAITYYPDHRPVDVVAGAPPIKVALSTLKAVLDTVRVTATRFDRDQNGFNERRRATTGRFLGAEDIARRHSLTLSDLFRTVQGLKVVRGVGETELTMRSGFGACTPNIYIDGLYLSGATADDIDGWVNPERVKGIEIYIEAPPPQFQQALSGCGSIVIWTR